MLVTHNGKFHADEVLAAAILMCVMKEDKVVRTRNPFIISKATVAFDVGFGKYDHHQKGGNGKRELSPFAPYSSAGLVWRDFGFRYIEQILENMDQTLQLEETLAIFNTIDKSIISEVDLIDNGVMKEKDISPTSFSIIVSAMNPNWFETEGMSEENIAALEQRRFYEATGLASRMLAMAVTGQIGMYMAKSRLKKDMQRCINSKVLLLSEGFYPWQTMLMKQDHKFKMVVFGSGNNWKVQTIQALVNGEKETICQLPEEWAGLNTDELKRVSQIDDAVFCHNGRFIAGTTSRASAIIMAMQAIKHQETSV